MAKINTIDEGIKAIYLKNEYGEVPAYEIKPLKEGEYTESLVIDGEEYPIFFWRGEPQTVAVANNNCGACSMKISGAIANDFGLKRFLYKEIETATWALKSDVKRITAFVNGNTANVIIRMQNETVAILELGATLPVGTQEQTRHTVWGRKGMVSSRIISQKVRGQSVYLFNDGPIPTTFNDEMSVLYGLSPEDCTKTVTIASMLLEKFDYKGWKQKHELLVKYVDAVYESSKTGASVEFNGGN